MEQLMDVIRRQILSQLDISCEISDEALMEMIRQEITVHGDRYLLSLKQRQVLQKQLFNSFRRLDVLQELLERDDITEIMVNGWKDVFYESMGALFRWDKAFSSPEKLENVVQQIAAIGNKTINEADPIVDSRLADGSRVNIVMSPTAVHGPCITIRKFSREHMSLERLVELESISMEMKQVFQVLVQAGYNIFVSGGTGSGKTSFLNALSLAIPDNERVITIEDSAELQLQEVSNLVRLEARMPNVNGVGAITIRDLIRTSLRMRPDRIIVGEVRGPEALELLQANNTGHSGSMSTGHANSCKDMLSRLETMVLMGMDLPLLAVRGQIASGIDILVHLGRMRDRTRKVLQVWEILGICDGQVQMHPLYEFQEADSDSDKVSGQWVRREQLFCKERLIERGLLPVLNEIYGSVEELEHEYTDEG